MGIGCVHVCYGGIQCTTTSTKQKLNELVLNKLNQACASDIVF